MRFMLRMTASSFISSHLDFFSCHMNLMNLTRESEVHEFVQFHLTITHINGQVTRSFCVWMSRVIFSCDGRTKQPREGWSVNIALTHLLLGKYSWSIQLSSKQCHGATGDIKEFVEKWRRSLQGSHIWWARDPILTCVWQDISSRRQEWLWTSSRDIQDRLLRGT